MSRAILKGISKPGILLGVILIVVLLFMFVSKPKETGIKSVSESLMEEKCVKCHDTQRIRFFKRTPQEWEVIVRRMREKDTGWLSEEDAAACLGFLKLAFSKTGKDLFVPLCVDCHIKAGKRQLLYLRKTREAWIRSIGRMQRKYSAFIGEADAKQIIDFWTTPDNNRNLKLTSEEIDVSEGVFEDKCGRCHTYQFIYGQKMTTQDWPEILNRMRNKSPGFMDEQDLERIKKYIFSNNRFLPDKK